MTQGILILIAALGGAFVGAIVSGGLLILSHHLQAKRDDRRQQLAFDRAVRSEPLERIKHAVDLGVPVFTNLQLAGSNYPGADSTVAEVHQFVVALNGARVSATTIEQQQVLNELDTLVSLTQRIASQVGAIEYDLLLEAFDNLARIERQYIELKRGV